MDIKEETVINKPIEEVWDLLGNEYANAAKWASGLYNSQGFGDPKFEGAECSNRACETAQGKFEEEMVNFDHTNHILSYKVIEGFPFFVDQAVNTWTLTKQGEKTKVNIHLNVKTKSLFGSFMKPMMWFQMGGLISNAICDFKQYLETGKPSKRKAKELKKHIN